MFSSSTYSGFESCEKYSFNGSEFTSQTEYVAEYSGSDAGYDIAFHQGNIWLATDNSDSPVRCYAQGSGAVLQGVESSIGIGSSIRGVAFESEYLWVSNNETDEIHRISGLSSSVSEDGISISRLAFSCSENPIGSSVVFHREGSQAATSILTLYDCNGRIVKSTGIRESVCMNVSDLPSGLYSAVLCDNAGATGVIQLIKL